MARGRPPGLELDADVPLPIGQHVADIDARGRLNFPGWLVSDIPWLADGSEVLAVFDEPGLIRLMSWRGNADAVLALRRQLATEGNLEAVRLLQDRYKRIEIPSGSRPSLGESALVHLGLTEARKPYVYLVRVAETLRIMAPSYRDRELAQAYSTFASLP